MQYKVRIEPFEGFEQDPLARTIAVTKSKIGAIGLSGDVTADPDDQNAVIVKVYGGDDAEKVEAFLFSTHRLELRKTISPPNPSPVKTYNSLAEAAPEKKPDEEILPYGDEGALARFVIVEKRSIVNGEDIRDASAVPLIRGQDYEITFSLKPDAASRFGDWTGRNIGNYLAVVLDGRCQSVAFIKTQMFDMGVINGRFSKAHAEDLALSLKSGFLPVKLTVVERQKIGN
jgi:preprotein translocase subunit SecD